jgi:serine/threonine-protein kinase
MAKRVAASVANAGRARVASSRQLEGDLDTIVLKAIQKLPERRYVSVAELSADISRHLAGLPVSARPDTWRYRSGKFITRHPVGVSFGAALVILLAGSAILTRVQLERVEKERTTAESFSTFLVGLFRASNASLPGGGETVPVRRVLDSAAVRLQSDLSTEPEARARLLRVIAESYQSLELYDAARVAIDSAVAIRRRIGSDLLALVRDLELSIELQAQLGHIPFAHAAARDVLTLRRRIHPARSIELADGLFYTGCMLVHDGPRRESEGYLREGITILRSHRDVPPVTLAQGLRCLGRLILDTELQRDSRYLAEAEQVLREALQLAQLSEPAGSPVLAPYHVDLSRALSRRGSDSGLIVIRRAIALHASAPEGSSVVPWEKTILAELLTDRGRLVEADSIYRHLIPAQRATAIGRTLNFGTWLKGYGRLLLECGDAVGAESILRESVAILGPAVSPQSRTVVDARVLLGSALARQRRFAEADSLLSANLPLAVALWGETDPRTVIARQASRDVRERPASPNTSDKPRCALVR